MAFELHSVISAIVKLYKSDINELISQKSCFGTHAGLPTYTRSRLISRTHLQLSILPDQKLKSKSKSKYLDLSLSRSANSPRC